METTNQKLREQFSERLKKEFARFGLPLSSPTQIAKEFNGRYPAGQITAQTVRKWLMGDAIPTQAKLVGLAEWLEVSPQWLRFGTGARKAANQPVPTIAELSTYGGVIVVGQHQALLVPIVELLTRLSPANMRLAERLVRVIVDEQEGRPR